MLTEPEINKEQLQRFIEDRYGLKVNELTFNPRGYASWSYFIYTDELKYFLKLYKSHNVSLNVFSFTYQLFSQCGIENIVHPVKTKDSSISALFENFEIILFNYIEGKTSKEQKLSDIQLEVLGELFAKIHSSKNTIGPYPVKESFENPYRKGITNIYNSLENIKNLNQFQKQTKEIYLEYKDIFLHELESIEILSQKLKHTEIALVNCHGEPSPDNIMISSDGKIYLIDWDEPLYAPKEKDLLFFSNRLDPILKGYSKISTDIKINEDIRNYYSLLWNVQEIEDWGTRILFEKLSDEEYKNNLAELLHFIDYSNLRKD